MTNNSEADSLAIKVQLAFEDASHCTSDASSRPALGKRTRPFRSLAASELILGYKELKGSCAESVITSIESSITLKGLAMNVEQTQIIQECALGALNGVLTFPEIVGKLASVGVERYHADYPRQEITYYMSINESLIVSTPHPLHPIAKDFSATSVESAVRQSQRNEHSYLDFIRKTTAAGCVGYFVQITGRRVIYFGRDGDSHTEHFPPATVHTTT